MRATGETTRLTGAGRWWYGMDEGLAACGWGQQNYCARCRWRQHKQSSGWRQLARTVIGRRGGAHASTATRVERKTRCPPRSTRPKITRRRATAGLAQQLRETSLAPCIENAFQSWVTPESCPLEPTPCLTCTGGLREIAPRHVQMVPMCTNIMKTLESKLGFNLNYALAVTYVPRYIR